MTTSIVRFSCIGFAQIWLGHSQMCKSLSLTACSTRMPPLPYQEETTGWFLFSARRQILDKNAYGQFRPIGIAVGAIQMYMVAEVLQTLSQGMTKYASWPASNVKMAGVLMGYN